MINGQMNKLQSAFLIMFVGFTFAITGCYYDNKTELYGNTVCDTANPTYTATIQPMINQNCIGCHGSSSPSGGISLTSYDQVKVVATKGSLEGTMNQSGSYALMPPGGKLTTCKLNQVAKWIRNGAPQ
jgi:uncharacterized membrane protein